jgi:hypothetical protein
MRAMQSQSVDFILTDTTAGTKADLFIAAWRAAGFRPVGHMQTLRLVRALSVTSGVNL